MARILVVDDEEGVRSFLADTLTLSGHDVVESPNGEQALQEVQRSQFHLMLTDLKMPGMDGMELLRSARMQQPDLQVVMLTAHGNVEVAVEAMREGAHDFIEKPLPSPAALRAVVERALEHRALRNAVEAAAPPPIRLSWGAPAMGPVVEALARVAPTQATVLLLGESGVGKEVAARTLHEQSGRKGPFVAINCAGLNAELLESELFGHERGAFTGAAARKRGRLELAEGGTFFLDEVGELAPPLQAKLLRVLQDRRFERVGGTQTLTADVRWVAATNRRLEEAVAEGSFRQDLYYRLAVFPIKVPPLRERKEDLLPLARTLLQRISAELGRPGLRLSAAAEAAIEKRAWPGNVRELANALERAAILSSGQELEAAWLETMGGPQPASASNSGPPTMEEAEREAIRQALDHCGGNRRLTAEYLGIGLRTLYEKIKRYDLR
ncbi:MAG: sigma-54-dependent Fis family transcriptional regulator [Deltaproteobacteria bacterium]|nr:MAG: sigma-54-dependent Fis family transcriptional regulator [Deltaproteobacteria bacterium]